MKLTNKRDTLNKIKRLMLRTFKASRFPGSLRKYSSKFACCPDNKRISALSSGQSREMRRLLLIDDDEVFIFLVKKMIENADRTTCIDIFSDGELAIDRLAALANNSEALPDVIFLDLNMPVMDGWSFLDHYSKIYEQFVKKIALYVLSSTITPQDIQRARDYSVISEFLIKPLDKIKIQQILSRGE